MKKVTSVEEILTDILLRVPDSRKVQFFINIFNVYKMQWELSFLVISAHLEKIKLQTKKEPD